MTPAILSRSVPLLEARLLELEGRLVADATAWPDYLAALNALVTVIAATRPEAIGRLLTTEEMAERLSMKPKTLLRHKAARSVKPAMQRGKLIRWKGDEVVR